jgi:hypothetical protein
VRNRPRPELDALGLHLGAFYIYPSLTNDLNYTDNVFATENDTKSDFYHVISPNVTVESDWNRHAVSFTAGGAIGNYFDETSENFQDAHARASGKLDIRTGTSMTGNLEFRREHETRGDPEESGGAEPTVFYSFGGGAEGSHRFNRVTVSVGGDVRRLVYDDTPATGGGTIEGDTRDRVQYRPGAQVAYEFSPGYSGFVRAEGDIRRYDKTYDALGFKRDSQGYDIVGGAALDVTGLIFGEAFAGIRQRFFEDDRFDTLTGPVVGSKMTWVPTGLTTVILNIDSQVIESTQANSPGYTSSGIGVTVDHELLRNLILTGGAGFRYDDYEGISREDKFYTGTVGADYLWNRYLSLGARYAISNRDSNITNQDYTQNLFTLTLTGKL